MNSTSSPSRALTYAGERAHGEPVADRVGLVPGGRKIAHGGRPVQTSQGRTIKARRCRARRDAGLNISRDTHPRTGSAAVRGPLVPFGIEAHYMDSCVEVRPTIPPLWEIYDQSAGDREKNGSANTSPCCFCSIQT